MSLPDALPRPTRQSRIAILGAGMAGIHFAHLLKRQGFRNVTVFERSGRIGGKVHTVEHEGIPHELGLCIYTEEYQDFLSLAAEYGFTRAVPLRDRVVRTADGRDVPAGDWIVEEVRPSLPWLWRRLGRLGVYLSVRRAALRYYQLHRRLFGESMEGGLVRNPGREALAQCRGNFRDFLVAHRLGVLLPLFRLIHTLIGYGYLETVPALYGLMWCTPPLVQGFLQGQKSSIINRGMAAFSYTFACGIGGLWTEMTRRDQLDVRLNQEVRVVRRDSNIVLLVRNPASRSPQPQQLEFDHLVIAFPARKALALLPATPEEQEVFGRLRCSTYAITLYESQAQEAVHAGTYWPEGLQATAPFSVNCLRYTKGSLDGPPYRHVPQMRRVCVAYQYGEEPRDDTRIARLFEERMAQIGARDVKILTRELFEYFWRYEQEDIDTGLPWRAQDLQGLNRTYYIGSSLCFESGRHVILHNLQVFQKYFSAAAEK